MMGTVEQLGRELARAVAILRDEVQDPEDLVSLLQHLGVPGAPLVDALGLGDGTEPDALPPSFGTAVAAIAALHQTVAEEASDSDEDGFDLPPLLAAVDAVWDAFEEIGTALADSEELGPALEELPTRALHWAVATYLEVARPVLAAVLEFVGAIEHTVEPAGDGLPPRLRTTVDLAVFAALVDDPVAVLTERFGWGDDAVAFDAVGLLGVARGLLERAGVVTAFDGVTGEMRASLLVVRPEGLDAGEPAAVELLLSLDDDLGDALGGGRMLWEREDGTRLEFTVASDVELEPGLRIEPPFQVGAAEPSAQLAGRVGLRLGNTGAGEPVLLLGAAEATRLEAAAWSIEAALAASAGLESGSLGALVATEIDDGALVLSLGAADGFLATFLPNELTFAFELAARFDGDGLHLEGGGGLKVTLPLQLVLGPLTVPKAELELNVGEDGLGFVALVDARIAIGPVTASAAGVGASATLAFDGDDVGPFGLELDFQPPEGIGLVVDAGPVRGGGFIGFFPDEGRYTGSLTLGIGDIGLTALGLLDTQMPDGSSGFSLLLVIHANFPPITLPFGFALTGVGGLVGINRRLDVDALRERFAAGTVGSILAPEDPVGNAATLFADLGEVFPATPGVHVVGPTVQLTWAVVVRFDLGIFIELPALSKIVLLGSVRATIGAPGVSPGYAQLRLDVIGVIDLAKGRLEFDAVLIDSHLMQVFELTGGAAFRLWWGDDANVTLSVGGFHPRFDPAPLVFPSSLTRIAMTRGTPQDALYLRLEAYLAVTTNTLQFGAAVEVVLRASRFVAEGGFAFDALIRFVPFSFEFDLSASLAVTYGGRRLASVRFAGSMTGPGPVVVTGELEFEILFVSISFSGTFSFGSDQPPPVETVASALTAFAPALTDPRHLQSAGASGDLQLEIGILDDQVAVLAPGAVLSWRQEHAPLEVLLDRYQGRPLDTRATLAVFADDDPDAPAVHEPFATGQFVAFDDADALDQPAFDDLAAGIGLVAGAAPQGAIVDDVDLSFDEYHLPETGITMGISVALAGWLVAAAADQQPTPLRTEPAYRVERPARDVVGQDGAVIAAGLSRTEAQQQRRAHARSVTTIPGDLVAVPAF